ncbi:MAG TPA: FliH/SctL family protein [Vicinamibacterales bacterium]|nr:FliH/SctL family protein [Vicinamibacterales bacterium]
MSSRARRIDPLGVHPFLWTGSTAAPAASPRMQNRPAAPAAAALEGDEQGALNERLAALERDAFSKGFAQGERAGGEASAQRAEAMLRRLTETLEELTTLRQQMIHETERQMVQLALAIARRVVHREVSLDQDLLIAMARVALDRLGESAQVTVRLSPEDFAATAAVRSAQWTGTQVTVVADARVGRGGCRVESEFGTMDAGVDGQIHEIARALLGEAA